MSGPERAGDLAHEEGQADAGTGSRRCGAQVGRESGVDGDGSDGGLVLGHRSARGDEQDVEIGVAVDRRRGGADDGALE